MQQSASRCSSTWLPQAASAAISPARARAGRWRPRNCARCLPRSAVPKLIHRRRSVHSSIRLSHHLRSQCRDETVLGRGSSEKILFIFFQRKDPAFSFSGFQDHFPAPASRPLPSTSFETSLPDQLPDHSLRSLQTIPVDLLPNRFP